MPPPAASDVARRDDPVIVLVADRDLAASSCRGIVEDVRTQLDLLPPALDVRRWRLVDAAGFVVGSAPSLTEAELLAAELEEDGADVALVAPGRRHRAALVVGGTAAAALGVAAGVAATAWRIRHRAAA